MKRIILLTALFFSYYSSFSQEKYSLEVNPLIRYDRYKEFVDLETVIAGKNYVQPSGMSWGINSNLIRKINASTILYFGVGYYRHTISNIKSRNNIGEGKAQVINYPSPLFIDFFTDKYYYNTFSGNLGYGKTLKLKEENKLTFAFDINTLYTFSQYYHLIRNPEGTQDYRKSESGLLGVLLGIDIGYMKSFKEFDIGPKLKLPIFSMLKKDSTFPNESNGDYRSKWFSGIGLGISFTYKLKSSKQ